MKKKMRMQTTTEVARPVREPRPALRIKSETMVDDGQVRRHYGAGAIVLNPAEIVACRKYLPAGSYERITAGESGAEQEG